MNEGTVPRSLTARVVAAFLDSNFSILLILLCAGMGVVALWWTPREEDPQIVVPFVDVFVETPGSSAEETQRLAAVPLERLLAEISGVEHVYSMCTPGQAMVTVRFRVGEDRERALVNVYNKIQSNLDQVPPQVSRWLVKPVEIDDVPILTVTLYGAGQDETSLVRVADELAARLQQVPDSARVAVHGGHRRAMRVLLDPGRLRALAIAPLAVLAALRSGNAAARAGLLPRGDSEHMVETGPFLRSAEDVASLVVTVRDGRPVQVRDVARVVDGAEEPTTYTTIAFGPAARHTGRGDPVDPRLLDGARHSAVTLSLGKRRGTNAVTVAQAALGAIQEFRRVVLPEGVHLQTTRNAGETANEKVNELIGHLLIAVATIVVLLGATLGWREALIVAVAVPLTLAVTLFGDLVVGYTINRVTLFALILSLGLLVDDPIVDVENIHRHLQLGRLPPREATILAVDEVRPPTILATFTVIVSFLPLFFVTGMMGPYMRPMPFNVPMAMLVSLLVAFTVTPWAAYLLLRRTAAGGDHGKHGPAAGWLVRGYRAALQGLLSRRIAGLGFLGGVAVLLVASVLLAVAGHVPLKMLPFDNKSEFQVVVNAEEGTPLERTDRAVGELVREVLALPEVVDVTSYTGHASPHDFNGLVRHWFLRRGGHVADLRVQLQPRHARARQSHDLVLAARAGLEAVAARHGVRIQIVESPPGPPVLAGVVAEVYAPPDVAPGALARRTREVETVFRGLSGLRDVDTWLEADRPRLQFLVDRETAALRGVSTAHVVETLSLALSGVDAGAVHAPGERLSLPLRLELPRAERGAEGDLLGLGVPTLSGGQVALGQLVRRSEGPEEGVLLRKDLRDVQYVTGEVVGQSPVDAVLALQAALGRPRDGFAVEFAGEGEWQVTVDVFRDMGIAFAAALGGIYILLVAQTGSFALSGLIMLAIPLTVIGIFPGFWLLNLLLGRSVGGFANPVYFTATGMIGMIALAGIVVRNSIILIDFIKAEEARGLGTVQACVAAGAVRLRPILLTAAAAVLGAWVIVFDPIFSGLAWSFVFGIAASTAFTVVVIPLVYALLFARRE